MEQLKEQDFIDEGFTFKSQNTNKLYTLGQWSLMDWGNGYIRIDRCIHDDKIVLTKFEGTIDNKEEFKTMLKQIGLYGTTVKNT